MKKVTGINWLKKIYEALVELKGSEGGDEPTPSPSGGGGLVLHCPTMLEALDGSESASFESAAEMAAALGCTEAELQAAFDGYPQGGTFNYDAGDGEVEYYSPCEYKVTMQAESIMQFDLGNGTHLIIGYEAYEETVYFINMVQEES